MKGRYAPMSETKTEQQSLESEQISNNNPEDSTTKPKRKNRSREEQLIQEKKDLEKSIEFHRRLITQHSNRIEDIKKELIELKNNPPPPRKRAPRKVTFKSMLKYTTNKDPEYIMQCYINSNGNETMYRKLIKDKYAQLKSSEQSKQTESSEQQ